jgi:hypothetical protein
MNTRRLRVKSKSVRGIIFYSLVLIACFVMIQFLDHIPMSTPLYGTYISEARGHVLEFRTGEKITITLGRETFMGFYAVEGDQMTIHGVYDGEHVEEVVTITDITGNSFVINGATYIKQ